MRSSRRIAPAAIGRTALPASVEHSGTKSTGAGHHNQIDTSYPDMSIVRSLTTGTHTDFEGRARV